MNHLSHRTLITILLLLGFAFLMAGNGMVSLTHPDEVFYAQTAKEMIQRDSWLTPYIFGEPQFEKPILTFWLMAVAFKFAGISAFVARFWPGFFGMLGLVVTYWMAWMLFKNKRTAFLSGFVLGTSFIYLALSRAVLTDMIFSVLVVTSLAFFYCGYSDPKRKRVGIIGCFMVSALAVLTKGVLGFLFPATTIAVFLLYKKDRAYFRDWSTLAGIALFLVIAVPWHVLMYNLHGQPFVGEYWWNVHVQRIYDAEHQKSNTWYFYLGTMFGGMFPWSLFLIPTAYLTYKQLRYPSPCHDPIAFLFLWIAMVYWCVQPAQSKLASYHFPLFPALAILTANYFDNMLSNIQDRFLKKTMVIAGYIMAASLFVGAVAVPLAARQYNDLIPDKTPVYIFSMLSLLGGCVLGFFSFQQKYFKMILANSFIVIIVLATLFTGRLDAEPWVSCKGITDVFKKLDHSDSVVLCSKFFVRGVQYYTDRETAVIDINGDGFFTPHPIPFLNSDGKVLEFLSTQPMTYAIVKHSNFDDLKRIGRAAGYDVDTLGEDGGKFLLRIMKSTAIVQNENQE